MRKLFLTILLITVSFLSYSQSFKKQLQKEWYISPNFLDCQDPCCDDIRSQLDTLLFRDIRIVKAANGSNFQEPFISWTFKKGGKLDVYSFGENCPVNQQNKKLRWKLYKKIMVLSIGTDKKHMQDYIIFNYDGEILELVEI